MSRTFSVSRQQPSDVAASSTVASSASASSSSIVRLARVSERARSGGPASRSRCAPEIVAPRSVGPVRDAGAVYQHLDPGLVGAHQAGDAADQEIGHRPELALRSALHRRGLRFVVDRPVPGGNRRRRVDILLRGARIAVFVDGCFWHVCPEHGRQPTTNEWYWAPKLRRNMERDRRADELLSGAGWTVVRIWEHESLESAVGLVTQNLP